MKHKIFTRIGLENAGMENVGRILDIFRIRHVGQGSNGCILLIELEESDKFVKDGGD